MTQNELLMRQLQTKVLVRQIAVEYLWKTLASLPDAQQPLQNWATTVIKQAGQQSFPWLHPVVSDMTAQEYKEALQEMFDGLMKIG